MTSSSELRPRLLAEILSYLPSFFLSLFLSLQAHLKSSLNPSCGSLCENASVSLVDIGESVSGERWLWDVSNVPGVYSVLTQDKEEPLSVDWTEFIQHRSSEASNTERRKCRSGSRPSALSR
ncbi:Lysosomal protein NCUG1Alike [Caligus rogercresseyi]|uniref:Lysosomal protein NCUG1Alike n=1 Tax=Caligus rogercresseyi TaxID=217165 RepID=A0A7T8KDB5_CALRO|nr:Lysosomal protein NCUG1Alike [Caligus rogercresseyi]